jgi:hypothetical protein
MANPYKLARMVLEASVFLVHSREEKKLYNLLVHVNIFYVHSIMYFVHKSEEYCSL